MILTVLLMVLCLHQNFCHRFTIKTKQLKQEEKAIARENEDDDLEDQGDQQQVESKQRDELE